VSPELIAAVFAGLVALVGAVSTFTARRSQRQAEELTALREENAALRASNGAYLKQRRLTDQWVGQVLRFMDLSGVPVPDPPEGLFDDFPYVRAAARASGADPAGGPDRAAAP
jgi:hypothetical protein